MKLLYANKWTVDGYSEEDRAWTFSLITDKKDWEKVTVPNAKVIDQERRTTSFYLDSGDCEVKRLK